MLGLISLEVCNSLLIKLNGNNKVKISKPMEKKDKRYSSKDLKIDDEKFGREDLKDELLGPVVVHKLTKKHLITSM